MYYLLIFSLGLKLRVALRNKAYNRNMHCSNINHYDTPRTSNVGQKTSLQQIKS